MTHPHRHRSPPTPQTHAVQINAMAVAMVSNVVAADAATAAAGVCPPTEKASHGWHSHQHRLLLVTDLPNIPNMR
jgi:hypothetical protein